MHPWGARRQLLHQNLNKGNKNRLCNHKTALSMNLSSLSSNVLRNYQYRNVLSGNKLQWTKLESALVLTLTAKTLLPNVRLNHLSNPMVLVTAKSYSMTQTLKNNKKKKSRKYLLHPTWWRKCSIKTNLLNKNSKLRSKSLPNLMEWLTTCSSY